MICDPLLTALFTPARPELGRYEVCATSEPLEAIVAGDGASGHPVRIEALEALDAFGAAGPYNRAALARLYGGTRVRVARRWRRRDGQFIAETLLSPYPDATLTHLAPGTMIIRFTLDHPFVSVRSRGLQGRLVPPKRQREGGSSRQRAKAGDL